MVSIRDRVSRVLLTNNVNCLFFSSKYDFCKTEIIEEEVDFTRIHVGTEALMYLFLLILLQIHKGSQ